MSFWLTKQFGYGGLNPAILATKQLINTIMEELTKIYGVCTSFARVKDLWHITIKDEQGEHIVVASNMQVNCDLECDGHYFVLGETIGSIVLGTCVEEWGRICSHCGKHHTEGYYSENKGMYFCSEDCLKAEYTQEEIDEEIIDEDGNGYLYWTEWEN